MHYVVKSAEKRTQAGKGARNCQKDRVATEALTERWHSSEDVKAVRISHIEINSGAFKAEETTGAKGLWQEPFRYSQGKWRRPKRLGRVKGKTTVNIGLMWREGR